MFNIDYIGLLAAALVLGLTAYLRGSRLVLAVALTAFAAWMSAEMTFSFFLPFSRIHLQGTGWRLLGCAAVVVTFCALQTRYLPQRRGFIGLLEGYAVHLAGIGAVLLTLPGYFDRPIPSAAFSVGITALGLVVLLIGGIGWRRRQKGFLLTSIVYAVIGIVRLEVQFIEAASHLAAAGLVTLILAIILMWQVRKRFRNRP